MQKKPSFKSKDWILEVDDSWLKIITNQLIIFIWKNVHVLMRSLEIWRWRTSCKLVISVDVKDLYQVFIPAVYINFICSIWISAVLFELPLGMDFLCLQFESPIVLFECSKCSIWITKGVILQTPKTIVVKSGLNQLTLGIFQYTKNPVLSVSWQSHGQLYINNKISLKYRWQPITMPANHNSTRWTDQRRRWTSGSVERRVRELALFECSIG